MFATIVAHSEACEATLRQAARHDGGGQCPRGTSSQSRISRAAIAIRAEVSFDKATVRMALPVCHDFCRRVVKESRMRTPRQAKTVQRLAPAPSFSGGPTCGEKNGAG